MMPQIALMSFKLLVHNKRKTIAEAKQETKQMFHSYNVTTHFGWLYSKGDHKQHPHLRMAIDKFVSNMMTMLYAFSQPKKLNTHVSILSIARKAPIFSLLFVHTMVKYTRNAATIPCKVPVITRVIK
ncbi:hypothetical protein GOP47_0026003 [Adiantum capillus-veneris]|uniref:Uncharacterized protein n=1 Tax=Adiantum capillus-veneris TaxID=13818 RepID=A0A9D4U3B9_ADICA|nr:hypothetical protein GOP47_0026003 [Adiantum capillus-veneris]